MLPTLFLFSFLGTLTGGLLALFSSNGLWHRLTQTVVVISGLTGAVASVLFLLSGSSELAITSSQLFFGMQISIDRLAALFFGLVSGIGAIASYFGTAYIEAEHGKYDAKMVHALTAFFLFGMQGVLFASNAIGFLVFWEVMSISSFFLVMADREEASVKAALFYLVMTHLGAGAILAGFLLLSGGDAFLSFAALGAKVHGLSFSEILLPVALLFFGFSSKAGLWPFHPWLPEAHPQAPSHVSALMSGVMLKIAIYGVLRLLLDILPPLPLWFGVLFLGLGLISAIMGSLRAVISIDIKRILAYSSIENIGLLFVMLGIFVIGKSTGMNALSSVALTAVLIHTTAHALFKSGLFLGTGAIAASTHTRNIEKLGGLAARMPKVSSAMMILALAAAALPPFGAFLSEWLLLQVAVTSLATASFGVKALLILTIVAIALVSGLAIFAMVRFFGIGFLAAPRSHGAEDSQDPSFPMWGSLWILALGVFGLGVSAPVLLISGKVETLKATLTVLGGGMTVGSGSLSLGLTAAILVIVVGLVFLARRALSTASFERKYHTWDCGQRIDATMEYTGTAFAAPIHFFFLQILGSVKRISATPVVSSNPWICSRKMVFDIVSPSFQWLYRPLLAAFLFVSIQVRKIQNGVIQLYIGMIFAALVITIIFSL